MNKKTRSLITAGAIITGVLIAGSAQAAYADSAYTQHRGEGYCTSHRAQMEKEGWKVGQDCTYIGSRFLRDYYELRMWK